jgi:hypothetical protein
VTVTEGSEDQDRGAHGLDQLVRRKALADRTRVNLDAHFFIDGHSHAHAPEQLDHGRDVLEVRHVGDRHRPVDQQRAGQNRQRGILGARDAHLALERLAPGDLQNIQCGFPWLKAVTALCLRAR